MRAAVGLNLKVVESLVLVSVMVYMRGPTAPPSSSGGCQLTVAEKGPTPLTATASGAPGGTVYCGDVNRALTSHHAHDNTRGAQLTRVGIHLHCIIGGAA